MATMYLNAQLKRKHNKDNAFMCMYICIYIYVCVCAQEGVDDCYKRHIVVSNRLCLILFIVVFQLVVKLLSSSILPSMLFCNCMDLEAKDTRFISLKGLWWHVGRMYLKKHMWERCAEISTINSCMSRRFGIVNVFTSWTVELDSLGVRNIR